MFLSDFSHPIEFDEKSMELRKSVKALDEYGPVMDMPKDLTVSRKTTKPESVEELSVSENQTDEPVALTEVEKER